ncbi:Oidioi.mRNA.OKI2018_I69.XSR.g16890.t1.cds [Oikopleura dioica]|uniref:Oidioi.mRNA.OKI2018_I69.XSR.g16890.t1.cds n=1 Tax=Oikopleura dioica TaxID=34765 RepID=A0ABN7SHJ3_OIKDI|nr:Oidioi.mRNA.OKI2018_I69.XSR.g16890.t1.cds [Oikopleura dioica]
MNQFSCDANNPNTQCIDQQQICNGQRDCSNGLDETNCFQWGQWGSWDASTCSADKCKSQDTCDADCVVIRQRGCFDAYGNPMNVMMDPKCGDRQVLCGDKCGVSAEVKGTCEGCGGFTVTVTGIKREASHL